MRCPDLQELPPPPPGKTGWPWTEASASLPDARPDGIPWPRISIVTPSFNQAQFLEATLRSVLLQGYPDLEYFVLDGKSNDGSIEIIKKYVPWLTYWVSERDGGQSAAISRGLAMSSGLFTTWINSDDMLYRDALVNHASQIGFREGIVYVGDCQIIDEGSQPLRVHRGRVHNFEDLVRIRAIWRGEPRGYIVQPEVLFPRQLAQDVGGVDVRNHRTMDYDLWGRLLLSGATLQYHANSFRDLQATYRSEDPPDLDPDAGPHRHCRDTSRPGTPPAGTYSRGLHRRPLCLPSRVLARDRPSGPYRAAGKRCSPVT